MTRGIYNKLLARSYPAQKLTIILNGANTDLFQFQPEAGRALREKLGLQEKFVVIYAGIHGLAQGLDTVLKAAEKLMAQPDIDGTLVGGASLKSDSFIPIIRYKDQA